VLAFSRRTVDAKQLVPEWTISAAPATAFVRAAAKEIVQFDQPAIDCS
jgi:hypothetical protein